MKKCFGFLFIALLFMSSGITMHAHRVGLLIMATGKYIQFVPPLVESARTFFCSNHNVTYFVFTDQEAPLGDDVKIIYQKRLGLAI